MSLSSPHLRHFVTRALVDASGVAEPDPSQLAAAFNSQCIRLRQRLQPLFGTTAVAALFARAVQVATVEFPWLVEVVPKNGDPCSADATAGESEGDVGRLADGLAAVLAQRIGLLSALVGEDLVLPLVHEAWGTAMLAEDQSGPKVMNE
jgi:hypothetical protein